MTTAATLAERVEALAQAAELARGRYDDDIVDRMEAVITKTHGRLRHGSKHTVIALAGPTGSGKSSIFNAMAGAEVSSPGVRRPTTAQTHAVTWGADASPLLDWLDIRRRHHIATADVGGHDLDGLVLLDLPDFDSTEVSNRMEVDRVVELVDALVWIVEPQKYADQSLHAGYIRPLAPHGEVMMFVLSKSDLLDPHARHAALADFHSLLQADGIAEPAVLSASTMSGDGLEDLLALLALAVAEREKMATRLDADLRATTAGLAMASTGSLPKRIKGPIIEGFERAAGVDEAAAVVAHRYQRDAATATGWPPIRLLGKLRRKKPTPLRTPSRSPVAQAEIGAVLRDAGDLAASSLEAPWDRTVRAVAIAQRNDVQHALEKTNARAIGRRPVPPRWWKAAASLQNVFAAVAAIGAVWLIALAVVGGLLRIDVDALTPTIGDWLPIPSALLLGGVALGLVVTFVARAMAKVAGARAGRQATNVLRDELSTVATENVIAPMNAVLAERQRFAELVTTAAG
jgi:GTP-binding protein EngB required for normal cell division